MCDSEETSERPGRSLDLEMKERLVLVHVASEDGKFGWNFITGWDVTAHIEKEP